MPRENVDALRVGTWNIRWFPQGCSPSEECEENATGIEWLACAIAWMDLDLLAVQELLDSEPARVQLATLTDKLNGLTAGEWQSDFQECGPPKSQHVGFLWNRRVVSLSEFADVPDMNGASDDDQACAANLRPGRYSRVKSATIEGVDFHAVSVHFDSGTSNRDYQYRRTAASRIPFIEANGTPLLELDLDVIVLGDFNTMGREEPPEVDATSEIEIFDDELAPGFRRAQATPACTEYFHRRPGTLDHVVVSTGMREASASGCVTGYCAMLRCAEVSGKMPAAYERLSDHCPVVLEITDADLD
jgi:endonuclease/exonuclease/phosphatase family metal-dependent hydrolase